VPAGRTLNIAVGGLFANMAGNHTFLRENILMNDNVLQNAHDFKVGCGSTLRIELVAEASRVKTSADVLEYRLRRSSRACRPASSRTR
jgi:hypothetical protein